MPKIISHTPKSSQRSALTPFDPSAIDLVLTCQSGLETLVRRESEKLGLTESGGQDRLVHGKGSLETLYRLLIGSRFANRVYIEVVNARITDFDTLHDTLLGISWGEYLTGRERIVVEAASTRSTLSHTPTIQAVAQKAIYSTLYTPNHANAVEVHILILIVDDIARIMLDITGDALHKRGYRQESGEAPIKESLAAALVAFANWKYKEPLLDPFCGSGTIAIEAAMMARGMAPGRDRHFRIESLPFHDRAEMTSVKHIAQMRAYPSGAYHIYASDIDPEMIRIAKRNAERARVADDITFSVADFLQDPDNLTLQHSTIVTNPPYGNRLESRDLDEIYTKLEEDIGRYRGGFITSVDRHPGRDWSNKKLLNGSEECRYWYKK